MAVYDLTNRDSFTNVAQQIQNFINYSPQDTARNITLVGNKLDLEENRQVSFEEATRLAKKLGLAGVVETSAKTGTVTLDDAFFITAANALDNKLDKQFVAGNSTMTIIHNSTMEETLAREKGRRRINSDINKSKYGDPHSASAALKNIGNCLLYTSDAADE